MSLMSPSQQLNTAIWLNIIVISQNYCDRYDRPCSWLRNANGMCKWHRWHHGILILILILIINFHPIFHSQIGANVGIVGIKEHLGLILAFLVPVFVVVTIDMCPTNILQEDLKQFCKVLNYAAKFPSWWGFTTILSCRLPAISNLHSKSVEYEFQIFESMESWKETKNRSIECDTNDTIGDNRRIQFKKHGEY